MRREPRALSKREAEVAALWKRKTPDRRIAQLLALAEGTVRAYKGKIRKKQGAADREHWAVRAGAENAALREEAAQLRAALTVWQAVVRKMEAKAVPPPSPLPLTLPISPSPPAAVCPRCRGVGFIAVAREKS